MGKELTIISEPGALQVRSRPASWGFGFVLVVFLGALLWLMIRSFGGENASTNGMLMSILFGLISLVVFGLLIFMAIGHRELRADAQGLVYTAKILSVPIRARRIPWEQVREIRSKFIEAASEEVGYTTLEIQTTLKSYRFFALPTGGEELKQVVAQLKQIQKGS